MLAEFRNMVQGKKSINHSTLVKSNFLLIKIKGISLELLSKSFNINYVKHPFWHA